MKRFLLVTFLVSVIAVGITAASPAQAFFIEVPKVVKDFFALFKVEKLNAEEPHILQPLLEPSPETSQPSPDHLSQPSPSPEPQPPSQPSETQPYQPSPSPYQPEPSQPQPSPPPYEGDHGYNDDQPREDDEERQRRELENTKRGVRQIERSLRQLERMIENSERKGTITPPEIKEKLARAKSLIEQINNATDAEQIFDQVDIEELSSLVQELDDYRRETLEQARRMEEIRRGMRDMEMGMRMFDRIITKLERRNVSVPAELKELLSRVKTIFEAVKQAKTMEEMEAAGVEELPDLMMELDEWRNQLELLVRWPQTLRQMNREVKRLERELKKTQKIVDRLRAQEIDLSSEQTAFASAVGRLKATRDEAVAKFAAGEVEVAYELLEDEFYSQLEDVYQFSRIIFTVSNLGQFTVDYRETLRMAQQAWRELRRQRIDDDEFEATLDDLKDKGEEILALARRSPIDAEAVVAALDEYEDLKQQLGELFEELMGQEEEEGPLEKGERQLAPIEVPEEWGRWFPGEEGQR